MEEYLSNQTYSIVYDKYPNYAGMVTFRVLDEAFYDERICGYPDDGRYNITYPEIVDWY